MVTLYGRHFSRTDVLARAGTLHQFAGVTLMTLSDGSERGVRILEFRTGTGLSFSVLIDRGMDIGAMEHAGRAIGWRSPTGFRHPGLHEGEGEGGLAWLRSFSGLFVTCGLDHALGPVTEDASHFNYPFRAEMIHSIHGRASLIPARLTGYGERWEGDACTLWCEGEVAQATVFGENLVLTRRIEAQVGTDVVTVFDHVENRGFSPTPHMLLYHINVGYPLLDAGARYVAPITDIFWAAHADAYRDQGVGYRVMADPAPDFREQVWQHEMAADGDGIVPVALLNETLGLGFLVETKKAEFPCQLQWQNLRSGLYTLGIEPTTNHVSGHHEARERGELIWLRHGEARRYTTRLSVLCGADALASAEARIRAIAAQPDEDFPIPSGTFPPIPGRATPVDTG